jgi:hypothetical protein
MLALLPAASSVSGNPGAAAVIFFALLIGHALADFPLQGGFLANAKNRHTDLAAIFGTTTVPKYLWVHALTVHSLIHAGAVWFVTGSVTLALIEFVAHWVIDVAKCEGLTSFSADQLMHAACKLAFVVLLYFGPAWVTWTPA